MDIIALIGRILFGLIFLASGTAGHLMQADGTAGYAESRGVSNAKLLTQLSGILIIVGALSVMLGIYGDLGALVLIAYLIPTNIMIHHFWTDTDPMTQQMEMTQFMKNLSIIGGALLLFVLFQAGEAGWTLTDPLF